MPRVSKKQSADNQRKALRLKRNKAGAGKGLYLRCVEDGIERWDLTVECSDGKKRVRHLQIPVTATNDIFREEVQRVRNSIQDTVSLEESDIDTWIQRYVVEKNLSDNGKKCFVTACQGFSLDAEANRKRVQEIKDSGYKAGTLRVKFKHIRALFAYMQSKHVPVEQPITFKIKDGDPRTRLPTDDEIKILLASVDAMGKPLHSLYVRLLMVTGARCSTIERVRPCDMSADWKLSLYNVKQGHRYAYAQQITDEEVKAFWTKAIKDSDPQQPLFTHTFHDLLLRRMAVLFPRDCNGESLSPHSFRHNLCTRLINCGVPVATAAAVLDVNRVVMLKNYTSVTQEMVDEALAKIWET